MKKPRAGMIAAAIAAALLLFGPGTPAGADGTTPTATPEPTPSGNFTALAATAHHDGSVRVLVGLRTPVAPEGTLQPRDADAQRARISNAQDGLERDLADTGAHVARRFDTIPYLALRATPEAIARLARSSDVASVREDRLLKPTLAQSGPLVQADQAAAAGYSGSGETIAVLDTGVDKTHAFLAGKVVNEACFAIGELGTGDCPNGQATQTGAGAGAPCSAADCNHGTHVAGIAAGANGSVSAPNGVAKGASVMSVRVFSVITSSLCSPDFTCALAFTSDVIAGLQYVASHAGGVAAANMSLGGGLYSTQSGCDADDPGTKAAIDTLRSMGIATVVASGNDGESAAMGSPACISSAISVGATGDGTSWPASEIDDRYSDSASFLSLAAPGTSITSSVPGGGYATMSGTSMAAPHVAGAFAILRQKFPTASVSQLLARLQGAGAAVTDARTGLTFERIQIKNALDAGPPGAPTSAIATAGNASATVRWAAPASDGGASISGYSVTASPGGATTTVNGATTSATVAGLANNATYTFTVTASNAIANGPASAPSNAVRTNGNLDGYWIATANGRIFNYGTASVFGTSQGLTLSKPIVGAASTPTGAGVWLVASDGGIFSFGDAAFRGSTGAITLNKPIVGMAATPSGNGYWLVASDGGIFAFGDAAFYGSTGAITLNKPIVGMASRPTGGGYWLVASDGGIFSFGDATFYGSTGAITLNKPIVGMTATPSGNGYQFVASDGGVFGFGDASFHGSAAGKSFTLIVAMAR